MAKNYQSNKACIVCGISQTGMVTYHHVYTRKAYPNNSEDEWNLMSLCSWHHVETHKIGTVSFSKKYAQVNNWLVKNGWELIMGKWIHSI